MKKLWANVLVLMMIVPIFSFYSRSSNGIIAAEANKEGAVIAPKVHLIGQDEAGNPHDVRRDHQRYGKILGCADLFQPLQKTDSTPDLFSGQGFTFTWSLPMEKAPKATPGM